ncbi:deaminase [Tritonibacter mobilis]|uniref:deaminase n=1 Tax=Tritonibacter mobilis TaxID=379347 RepID=UPI0009BDDFD6|nr:deaminase [Tritonibacter mobilis]
MSQKEVASEEYADGSVMPAIEPELVFGLVGPLGSNIEAVQEALQAELRKVGYKFEDVHLTRDLSSVIPGIKLERLDTFSGKMDLMNEVVAASGTTDFLARLSIAMIAAKRLRSNIARGLKGKQAKDFQDGKTAYVIRQLKREQEAALLSKVYGEKFVQISISVSEEEQKQSVLSIVARENPELSQAERERRAQELIDRDREEQNIKHGQGIVNIYHGGDVFVGGNKKDISEQISRFIEAFFGSNFISPSKDELGSHLAKTASLRTLDLSRQVGAAIMSPEGDVITLGCNEVPKPLGGNYWEDDTDPQRDIERGVEPNKLETTRLIHDFIHALSKIEKLGLDPDLILKDPALEDILKNAFVSDITEFGRITHAEMTALSDAARLGRSTLGATIYVTTFPCHNCAKHLVAAGIKRIVYIEPYTKSKAFELSGDALSKSKTDSGKVVVEHFIGISPRRYGRIFEKPKKRRDSKNRVKTWHYDVPTPIVSDKSGTHIQLELQALVGFDRTLASVKATV